MHTHSYIFIEQHYSCFISLLALFNLFGKHNLEQRENLPFLIVFTPSDLVHRDIPLVPFSDGGLCPCCATTRHQGLQWRESLCATQQLGNKENSRDSWVLVSPSGLEWVILATLPENTANPWLKMLICYIAASVLNTPRGFFWVLMLPK